MEVVSDKYLPIEILTEILYHVPIKKIFIWVYTNKFINNLCNSIQFWCTYINGNQNKWSHILLVASRQGYYSMFTYLWSISNKVNIIIEHKILDTAFTASVKNEHNKLSEWIYSNYISWQINIKRIYENKDYEEYILYLYYNGLNTDMASKKVTILMKEAAINANIEEFRKICEYDNTLRYISKSLIFYAPNIEIFKSLALISYKGQSYSMSWLDILLAAMRCGNISLGTEIMSLIKNENPEDYVLTILESDNNSAFDFLMSLKMRVAILQYKGIIGNRCTMKRYLECNIPYNNLKELVLKSWKAFSFHQKEYIDIIYNPLQPLSDVEYENLYHTLLNNGEEYMAHLLKLKKEELNNIILDV